MKQKIHIITLGVQRLGKTLAFYEEGLGWKRSEASKEKIVFFETGGIVIAFFDKSELAKDANVADGVCEFSGITMAYNSKSEGEVDEVMKKVEGLGATIIKPAEKTFWGGYGGYFKDLDGHIFEVAYNPFVEFDENDQIIL
ncbi:VOC family protein [Gangjinia marincola]|uniref:VOC family protein n=1 Tax=Gangjinia marincola TaxID=578463 RepID=A0ABN1MHD9_9FLAO